MCVVSGLLFLTISFEYLDGSLQWQIITLIIAVVCFLIAAYLLTKTNSQQ